MFRKLLLVAGCLSVFSLARAQKSLNLESILAAKKTEWGLTSEDFSEALLKDQPASLHNGLRHYYYTQRYQGIEVYNAVMGLHFDHQGRLQYATSRFIPRLQDKINASIPVLTARQAILSAAIHLALDLKYELTPQGGAGDKMEVFWAPGLSEKPVEARLVYQPLEEEVRLAWEIRLAPAGGKYDWNLRVDAVTGEVLQKYNAVIHCQFPGRAPAGGIGARDISSGDLASGMQAPAREKGLIGEAQYRVFPLPVESPIHGARTNVVNPADPLASPFGWHDVDGQAGPEYMITRGNNAHAFQDRQDDDRSQSDEPDGGEGLIFDFSFDDRDSVVKNLPAALTQLFYTNNMVHDFAHHYGFDEAAGNFQQTNYSGAGKEGDPVRIHAQNGADINSPFQRNNASFTITADGAPPVMEMYVWEGGGGGLLRIDEPAAIAGLYETGTAAFGPVLGETPLRGELAPALDNSERPAKVCSEVINVAQVKGKIALVDRGDCFFQQKVLNVEAAGAIACVICNYEDRPLEMGAAANLPDPGIPAVILAYSDCARIRRLLDEGVQAAMQLPKDDRPEQLDSGFDNGIIVHEYAHGISTRLTGGASSPWCLNNDEDMGEGWSDFFALVLTHPSSLSGRVARGIGNYVIPLDVNGRGIRRFPYSTDPAVNNQTYDDIIATTAPHDVGEVWAAVLWDMYWAFIDAYGWDEDLFTGNGGNNMAIQLVIDGMKLQPCNPGFIDARDAILEADRINNGGANQCLIWEVFARRGLGWSARQNSVNSRHDGLQAFDVRPACIQELKIAKTVTPNVLPGDTMRVELTITNHKPEAVSNMVISDRLGRGLRLVGSSLSGVSSFQYLGEELQFSLEALPADSSLTITYLLTTDPGNLSQRFFLDDVEDPSQSLWAAGSLAGNSRWSTARGVANSGIRSWQIAGTTTANDQVLALTEPLWVTGERPVLRFFHRYLIEPAQDGGFVQISTDGGQRWYDLAPELFFRQPYRGRLDAATLAQPGIYAFWGASDGFIASYVDLSPYRDQEVLIRFRYSSDQENGDNSLLETGWWIDDIEFFDMYHYDTEACVTSAQGDRNCARAPGRGAVVEPAETTTDVTTLDAIPGSSMRLYPNPAREQVTVSMRNLPRGEALLSVRALDGRQIYQQVLSIELAGENWRLPTGQWGRGVYFVHLQTGAGALVTKLVLH